MGYSALHGLPEPRLGLYAVRSVALEDIEAIRQWRNAQIPVLRQKKPITRQQQLLYYAAEVWGHERSPRPPQMLFVLTHDKERSAYGGLTNIDWDLKRAELSFLAPPRQAADGEVYSRRFRAFLEIVVRGIAFNGLNLHRVWHEAYAVARLEQNLHHGVLRAFGFLHEGTLRDHVRAEGRWADSLVYGMTNG